MSSHEQGLEHEIASLLRQIEVHPQETGIKTIDVQHSDLFAQMKIMITFGIDNDVGSLERIENLYRAIDRHFQTEDYLLGILLPVSVSGPGNAHSTLHAIILDNLGAILRSMKGGSRRAVPVDHRGRLFKFLRDLCAHHAQSDRKLLGLLQGSNITPSELNTLLSEFTPREDRKNEPLE